MRERAKQNKLFSYIKIPQVIVRLSYKGSKEKNFEDISNVCLTVPNLEYHNVTWTWLDLWLAMKNDSRKVLLSQVSYKFETFGLLMDFRKIESAKNFNINQSYLFNRS